MFAAQRGWAWRWASSAPVAEKERSGVGRFPLVRRKERGFSVATDLRGLAAGGPRLAASVGAGCVLLAALSVHAQAPPNPLPLGWCLQRAEAANPDLDVARAAAEAANERIYPAGALPDPRIRYELSNAPIGDLDLGSTPQSGQGFGLNIRLPFPGLLKSRRKAASAIALAMQESVGDEARRVAAAVEWAWVELGFAQRALEITEESIDLLRQFAKIAEAKYKVGEGLQQSVIHAQAALTELLEERLQRQAAIRSAEARLGALLDLPVELSLPRTLTLRQPTPLPDAAALVERLEASSPRLRALAERIEAAEHRKRAVRLEGYPDFDVGVGYRVRRQVPGDPVEGDDFVGASVEVRLPLDRRKRRALVAEQDALVRQSRAQYRRMRTELRDVLMRRYADLEQANRTIALLEDGLLPQARQALDSSRAAYAVNKLSFLSLIDSQVRLLDAQLRLQRAIADRRIAFAAIEASVGVSLRPAAGVSNGG